MPDLNNSRELRPLEHLGVIEFAGADAARFLHGQLSSDVLLLADGQSQLTSFNTPKGRVVAILRLLRASSRLLGVLPRELALPLLERLRRYVLRAKVTLRIAEELVACDAPDAPHRIVVRAAPASSGAPGPAAAAEDWKRANIAAGIPEIYAPTSEMFVAQMLNLDLVAGISFTKGCYTGQEIIARTHNLGRIKRRMLRFATTSDAPLAPGDTVAIDGFGSSTVIETARTAAGDRELLAVVHLEPRTDPAGTSSHPRLAARELPLPYALPERPG